jgi:fibronectin-binding autotransporter adhesin
MKTTRNSTSSHFDKLLAGALLVASLVFYSSANATDVYRADNALMLDDPAAWTNGVTPTSADIAVWDHTVQVNLTSTLDITSLGTNWLGLRIADPAGAITILPGGALTLGAAGIDMSQLTNINLTLTCPVSLAATQTWNIATGRTVNSGGGINDADALGKVLIKDGGGVLFISTATTFIGGIQVNGGTLDPNNGLVSSVGTITLNGGTWSVNGTGNPNPIQVNDGTTNTLIAENNCGNFGVWTGGGTVLLNINAAGRVMTANSDMSAFNGTIQFAPGTGLGSFRANAAGNVGGTNVTFDLGNNLSGTLNKAAGGAQTFFIGALFGGPNTSVTSGQAENFDIGRKADSLFSGIISGGNAQVTKSGPTTLILAGANTYGLGTTISNGVLQIGNGGTSGQVGSRGVTNYATLAMNRSDTFAFTNIISGSGNVSNYGAGVLILAATNTHTGKTIVAGGTLVLSSQSALGALPGGFTADHLILNGGALGATNNFSLNDSTRGITLGANGGGMAPGAGTTLTIPNSIAGSGNLTVSNAGTVSLTTANAYTGKTILKSGTLALASQLPLGPNPGGFTSDQLTLDGGTLRATASFAINDANRGTTVASGGGTVSPDGGATLTFSTPVAGSGTLTVNGAGTATLNAANPLGGNIAINQGTLAIGASGTIPSVPTVSIASGATLNVTAAGLSLASGQSITGNGSISGNLTAGTGSTLSPGTSIGQLSVSGTLALSGGTVAVEVNSSTNDVINVTGNLTRSGTTTIQLSLLSAVSSGRRVIIRYTGTLSGGGSFALSGAPSGTTIDTSVATEVAVVFNINSGNLTWVGDGSLNLWDTSSLNWFNGVSTVAFNPFDNVTFGNTGSQSPAVNITSSVLPNSVTVNATGNYTFGGTGKISGVGGLTKNNTGNLTILTVNDYLGGTLLGQGLVQVGNGSTSGSLGAGTVTNNTRLVFNLPGSGTQSGDVTGTGSLTVQAGTLTLAGNGSYSGTTTNSATLRVGAGGSTGSLGSGAVQNDGSLVFDRTGTITNAGSISGVGSLTKQGSGTVALAANNNYAGATTISAGTLQIGAGGTSGTLGTAPTVSANGTLAFNRSDLITSTVVVSGTGRLEQKGPGTLTLVTTNSYSGGTIVSGGTLQLGDGVLTATLGTGSVTNNGTLVINRPDDFFLTNAITGSGTLVKVGTNTLRFNNGTANANTYSGGTVISNGMIRLGPDGEGDPGQANGNSLGSGPVTFYGGALRLYNHTSQLLVGNNFTTPIAVPAGQSGTVLAGQNGGAFLPTSVTGSGTLGIVLNPTATPRNSIGGNWTAFTGQMIAMGDTPLRISTTDFRNTEITISNITTVGTIAGNNQTYAIGALSGTGTLGPVDQGSTGPTWVVGSRNTAATFDGTIADAGVTSVRKVGTNTWTLTGANSYTGTTIISNGVLALSTNAVGGDGSIAGSSAITIVSPGMMDVTRLSDGTLHLGTTLRGNGVLTGQLDGSGTVAPGLSIGTLTVSSNATLNGILSVEINGSTHTSDKLVARNIVLNNSTIVVTNLGTALNTGDTFQILQANGGTISGSLSSITGALPPGPGASWNTSNLTVNGTITVILPPSPRLTNSISGGGTTLDFSWDAAYIGWRLYAQTNSTAVGLSNNWVPIDGTEFVNQITVGIDKANGTVFYRLQYP